MKKKPDITVIISARNEGEEVLNTLQSLYDTGPKNMEVILVNDHSDKWIDPPEYDGLKILHLESPYHGLYDAVYKATEIMLSDKFFFCNSRCRFTPGWEQEFIKAIDKEPENLFTPTCAVLSYDNTDIEKADRRYGAKVELFNPERPFKYYQIKPITNKSHKPVACFGGFGISRDWFLKLGGFYPLKVRGAANAYISLKVWKAGGEVKVLPVVIGNIFREEASYPVAEGVEIYNYAALAYVLRGPGCMDEVLEGLKNKKGTAMAKHVIVQELIQMKFERMNIMKLKKRDITNLLT